MYKNTKYPSIPHLPNSKYGKDDKGIHAGMAQYCISKYRPDTKIIVTEKVDGSNVSIINEDGVIKALSRGGYLAEHSNYEHHRNFASYVNDHYYYLLNRIPQGERVVIEDLTVPHGTIYKNAPRHLVIDWKLEKGRKLWDDYEDLLGMPRIKTIYSGLIPISVDDIKKAMPKKGFYKSKEGYEGLVYRVEREGKFDFLAKWVRHDYTPLKYLK